MLDLVYAAVTVRQIASAAGISPALVIHHYGSKENLRAILLLPSHISAVTGIDPLARDGLVRWSAEVFDVYTNGVFAPVPPAGQARGTPPGGEAERGGRADDDRHRDIRAD